ncbi:ABC transporter ATP-binding protein [Christensenella sp. MSJ-20]|uniref:ABC transporter ATP-binding protein n=1 Tax=Christensenella sp. MSJ-20 TaxID=2841518 RepID=UPI001C76918A|nr:ABC transporter ATP-binding protein [Christensenella sp. MSJ-20]
MNALEIRALTKVYEQHTAVDHLTLDIREGELFGLLGVNGAGKSTTIKMLSCLCRPTAGDALLLGDSILTAPHRVKEKINVSPQETAVAPNLSVAENLALMAGIYGSPGAQARERVQEMLVSMGLTEVEKQKAKTLSGGWQRRLSIAMALITRPRILFLDEPTLGLDVLARRELWGIIRSLKGRATVILTTHYMEEAQSLCDRIAVMVRGRLRAVGTVDELMAQTKAPNFEEAFVSLCEKEESL